MKTLVAFLLSTLSLCAAELRVATFNVSMFRDRAGELIKDCTVVENPQLQSIARIIRQIDADVILLNEFDYDPQEEAAQAFLKNYLPDLYPHYFSAPVNTGVPSGFDLNGDGDLIDPEDAFGYGKHPGQYGMLLLSKSPILRQEVRTFQKFLWKDLPSAIMPAAHYPESARAQFRLSSKSHWDVPVKHGDAVIHLLCSHPTPPSFDDGRALDLNSPKPVDWNGRRNADEIRFWAEYIKSSEAPWLRDDQGKTGGLAANKRFVILGDLNADPADGDSLPSSISSLLDHPQVMKCPAPISDGALEHVKKSMQHRDQKTSHFHLRCDYALPSQSGFSYKKSAVHWPTDDPAVEKASDHRLVWIDLLITP